jgi:hypothetical protein
MRAKTPLSLFLSAAGYPDADLPELLEKHGPGMRALLAGLRKEGAPVKYAEALSVYDELIAAKKLEKGEISPVVERWARRKAAKRGGCSERTLKRAIDQRNLLIANRVAREVIGS